MKFRTFAQLIAAMLTLFGADVAAREIPADVSSELNEARKAWRESDELTAQIVKVSREGGGDLSALLDTRENAFVRASDNFGKALEKDKSNPQALFEFGRYWISHGDFQIARRYLEGAWLSDFSPAADKPEKKDAKPVSFVDMLGTRAAKTFTDAEKADLLRTLGGLSERAGETANALMCYRGAFARNPTDPRNRLSLAVGVYASGNMEETETLLRPWDEINAGGEKKPNCVDFPTDRPNILSLGLYTLGLAKEQLGYQDETLRLYRLAEELSKKKPENREVTENARLAVIRMEDRTDDLAVREKEREKELAKVREYNERIAKEDAALPEAKRRPLSREPDDEHKAMREAFGMYETALTLKKQALRDPTLLSEFGKLRINAIKAADLENVPEYSTFKQAEQTLQEAIMKYAKHPRLHFELATAELFLHRYSSARTLLDAAALYNPNDIATLNLRGAVLLELGQWEEAATVYRRLLALDGDNGAGHFGLARALAALKSNESVCEASLDAFGRAARLGVRDERMKVARAIRTKDGQVFAGIIISDGEDYIVKEEYAAPFRIEEKMVDELIEGPGLRDQVAKVLYDYRHGISPPEVKRIVGRKRNMEDETPRSLRPEGTIFAQ